MPMVKNPLTGRMEWKEPQEYLQGMQDAVNPPQEEPMDSYESPLSASDQASRDNYRQIMEMQAKSGLPDPDEEERTRRYNEMIDQMEANKKPKFQQLRSKLRK